MELNSKTFEAAAEKFRHLGPLAVTAADHLAIGSTPPQELRDNPGKNLAEIFSDEEIAAWLFETREAIADFSQPDKTGSFVESSLKIMRDDLEATERYLKQVGRI